MLLVVGVFILRLLLNLLSRIRIHTLTTNSIRSDSSRSHSKEEEEEGSNPSVIS